MSAAHSATASHPSRFDAVEIKTALAAWGMYLAGTCGYCLLHQAIVRRVTPDLGHTLILALREWGVWIFVTPLVFRTLTRFGARELGDLKSYAVATLVTGAAALVPTTIDQITDTRNVASSLVIFWPRYVAALVVVYFIWYVFLRKTTCGPSEAASLESGDDTSLPQTLLVSKGADQCLIRVEDIQYLSAAGNYIDICARNQRYLTRATMKQLQELLPSDRFVRIHRSHIVSLEQIERIKVHRSGSGTVHLRCGTAIGISKKYRAQLQRYRPH